MASAAGEIADLERRAEQLEDEAMQHERDQQPIAAQAKLQKAKALRDKVLALRQGTDMDDSKLLIKELVKSHEKLCTNLGELSTNLGHFMADNSSGTLEGSKVTDDEIDKIDQSMEALRIPENNKGVETLQADRVKYTWLYDGAGRIKEDTTEQITNVVQFFSSNINSSGLSGFHVQDVNRSKVAEFPKASFANLPRNYRARGDYLILQERYRELRDPVMQRKVALVAIEVKTELRQKYLAQARLGFYVYGALANAALLYVLTDLVTGGVVFWATHRQEDGALQVHEEVIDGMGALFQHLRNALTDIPTDLIPGGSSSRPRAAAGVKLGQPAREKFYIRGLRHPKVEPGQLVRDAWKKNARDSDDEQDLRAWYPNGDSHWDSPMQHAWV